MNVADMTIVELREYINSLSNEELDKAVAEIDLSEMDGDLDILDLLKASRLYDYMQYKHNGEADIEL